MGRFGVGDDSRVVLYSTTAPQWAARVWWMLRNYGFDNAAVLNGGFQKWAREGRPVETGPAQPRPAAKFTVREDRKLMVGKEAVRDAIGDAGVCTINALQPQQHAGTGGNVYGRVGRIAKSVNVPAASLIDPADRRAAAGGGVARQVRRGRRLCQAARDHLLRRRHRRQHRRAGAGHARPPRRPALRRLDVGMVERRQPADGAGGVADSNIPLGESAGAAAG